MSWLSTKISALETWFSSEEKAILRFLEGAANNILKNGGPVLVSAAVAAVAAAETQGGSGSDKLKAATDSAVNVLKSQGIPVVMSAVNAAIEGAVSNLQAQAAAAATSSTQASK